MTINRFGNVGIGVNSPDKRLVVHKEDANNSGITTLLSLQKINKFNCKQWYWCRN